MVKPEIDKDGNECHWPMTVSEYSSTCGCWIRNKKDEDGLIRINKDICLIKCPNGDECIDGYVCERLIPHKPEKKGVSMKEGWNSNVCKRRAEPDEYCRVFSHSCTPTNQWFGNTRCNRKKCMPYSMWDPTKQPGMWFVYGGAALLLLLVVAFVVARRRQGA